ncbi:MAG: hypothetical protein V7739_16415 [Motiliproteus sp.]
MNNDSIVFIGLDTQKESTEVGYSTGSRDQPVVKACRPCLAFANLIWIEYWL